MSGKGKSEKIGKWLCEQLTVKRKPFDFYLLTWPDKLTDYSDIWLVGGDGTINFFLNKYPENTLPLSFFKGGTGNDFAWMLYGNKSKEDQLNIALTSTPKQVDAASCNGTLFVNSSGIGFDGEVLRSIGTTRKIGGHLGYLLIVLQKIFSFKEHHFKITTTDKVIHGKFLLVIVNNSSRTGGGFMVTPTANVTDGKLNMLLCDKLSILKRLRYLPVIEKGKHMKLPFISASTEESVCIETGKTIYAQLDGELIESDKFELKIIPGKLSVRY